MKKKIYSVVMITESQDYSASVTIAKHTTNFDSAEKALEEVFKNAIDDFKDTYGEDEIRVDKDRYIVETRDYHDSLRCEIQEGYLDEE